MRLLNKLKPVERRFPVTSSRNIFIPYDLVDAESNERLVNFKLLLQNWNGMLFNKFFHYEQ